MKRSLFLYGLIGLFVLLPVIGVAPSEGGTTLEFWDVNTRAPHVAAFGQLLKDFEKETGISVKKSIFSTSDALFRHHCASRARRS